MQFLKKTKTSKLVVALVVVVLVVALALGLYFGLTSMQHHSSPTPAPIPVINSNIVSYRVNGSTTSNSGSCGTGLLTTTLSYDRREVINTSQLNLLRTNLIVNEQNNLVLSFDKVANMFSLTLRGKPVDGFAGSLLGTMAEPGTLGKHFAYLDFSKVPSTVKDMLPKTMVTKFYLIEDYTNSQLASVKVFTISGVDLKNNTYCVDPSVPDWKTPAVLMS